MSLKTGVNKRLALEGSRPSHTAPVKGHLEPLAEFPAPGGAIHLFSRGLGRMVIEGEIGNKPF